MGRQSLANNDEIKIQPFSCGDENEDLLDWSKKLEALGMILEALAFRDDKILSMHGERLGQIVTDYARAIHQMAEEVYWAIDKFYKEKRAFAMTGNHAKAQGEDL